MWLCELAPVSEQGSIPDAVAAAVGYAPPQGVSVADGLPRFLERKELLLVLDNCEHLVDAAAAFVSSTTAAATRVSVLATSREALGVRGEQIFPLASLGLPVSADAVSVLASEAGALFVARAGEAGSAPDLDGPTATAVYDLCVRLDGIPLAIELAAARTAMMTPAEIVARLDRQFQLLTGGRRTRLERHQTLRAAIDWSYDLLDDDERGLLNRLSVCVGGFDLDAASAIAAGAGCRRVRRDRGARLAGRQVAGGTVRARWCHPLPVVGDDPPVRHRAAQQRGRGGGGPRRPRPPLPGPGRRPVRARWSPRPPTTRSIA